MRSIKKAVLETTENPLVKDFQKWKWFLRTAHVEVFAAKSRRSEEQNSITIISMGYYKHKHPEKLLNSPSP